MAPPVDQTIKPHEDNEGAMRVAKSRFSSRRTRHVGVKHHIVRDKTEGGIVFAQNTYVRSEEYHARCSKRTRDPFFSEIPVIGE